jgi:hypothetical protein
MSKKRDDAPLAGATGGRGKKAPSVRSSYGETAAYLVRRLKRDAPASAPERRP